MVFDAVGATKLTPGTSSRSASTSAAANSLASSRMPPPLPRCSWPRMTISMLAPRLEMSDVTRAVAPLPSVTMTMTAATPITMPSTVSEDRMRLRRIAYGRPGWAG